MKHVLHDVYGPTWEGQFWVGNRQTIVKYSDTLQSSVQTRLNWSIWHFGCGLSGQRMHKFNRICHVAPMCPHGRTRCHHLSNNIEPYIYGGDAPYVKLLWPHLIFGHAHLDSGTDSQARFVLSTVLWAFHTIQPSSPVLCLLWSCLFLLPEWQPTFLSQIPNFTLVKMVWCPITVLKTRNVCILATSHLTVSFPGKPG